MKTSFKVLCSIGSLISLFSTHQAIAENQASATPSAPTAASNTPSAPLQATGVKVISATELKEKIDKKSCKVIDVRAALEYSEEHVPSAVNIPYKERSEKNIKDPENFDEKADRFDLTKLPANKTDGLCFYCRGEKCWASYKASLVTKKSGRTNVFWVREGMPAWKSQNYATEKMGVN